MREFTNGEYVDRVNSPSNRMSYLYDGLGFNIIEEGPDNSVPGIRNGWNTHIAPHFTSTSEYIYVNGKVISRTDVKENKYGYNFRDMLYDGLIEKEYYGHDPLGSVMLLSDEKGDQQQSYKYDAFGRMTEGHSAKGNDLGYNGKKIEPATGWVNYGFRDYLPELGRFTTIDPIKDGLSWFAYVSNDPINYIDPDGLEMKIAGSASFKQTALADMQKLTRDTLALRSDGTVIITNVSDNTGTLDNGTELIRKLNTKHSVTGREKDKHIITIEETSGGNMRRTTDSSQVAGSFNGAGTASTVEYNPSSNPSILTTNQHTGNTVYASRPPEIGLGHELIHADHAREGTGAVAFDPVTGDPMHAEASFTYQDLNGSNKTVTERIEELRTVGLGNHNLPGDITENDLRDDQGLCDRAAYK